MSVLRRTGTGVGVVATLLLAVACTPGSQVVDGNTLPNTSRPTTSPSTTPTARTTIGGPLMAEDLPGWSPTAVPANLTDEWASGCGTDVGVHKLTTDAQVSALARPGVYVVTRTSKAKPSDVTQAMMNLRTQFTNCGTKTDGGSITAYAMQPAPEGIPTTATGALITTRDKDGVATDAAAYWAVPVADGLVEVYTDGILADNEDADPMYVFSGQVLTAALAKASGATVPGMKLPQPADEVPSPSTDDPDAPVPSTAPGVGGEDGPT